MLKAAAAQLKRIMRWRNTKALFRGWSDVNDIAVCADTLRTMRHARLLEPKTAECPAGRRILVIAPHTDDETIGPGGTLLKAIKAGCVVQVLYLTTNTPQDVSRSEAADASRKAGYAVTFLDMPVGAIPVDEQSATSLAVQVSATKPDQLFLPFFMDDHDDHRRANELLLAASRHAAFPRETEIWAYQVYGVVPGNTLIDITEVADAKADLIRCWRTQMSKRDWSHYALGMNAFNSRFIRNRSGPTYAEIFLVLPIAEYLRLCSGFFKERAKIYHHAAYAAPA